MRVDISFVLFNLLRGNEWDEFDKKNKIQLNVKIIYFLYYATNKNEYNHVCQYKSAKKIWTKIFSIDRNKHCIAFQYLLLKKCEISLKLNNIYD